jgi:DNA-directed RNA polymerase
MRDIADVNKARTAFAVNGNHANDATLVKQYHLWGRKNNIPTATVHDAFMANAADLLKSRDALREIYANVLDKNVILDTLNEMRDRGLSKELYDKYLNEAIDIGLIPIAGRSVVGGKKLQESDILKKSDVLVKITHDFKGNHYWYGIG